MFTKFGIRLQSSSNRNDSVNTKLPNFFFFIIQTGKIAGIFPKKIFEKCTLCENSKLFGWVL